MKDRAKRGDDAVQALRKRVRQLEDLLDMCAYLSSSLNLRTTLSNIGQLCRTLLRGRASSIMLLDEDKQVLRFEIVTGEKGKRLKGMEVRVGEGIAGRVAESGQAILVADCQKEPRHAARFDDLSGFITRSLLCVPMVARGRIVGVVEVLNKVMEPEGDGEFDEADLELALGMANVAASAVLNAQLFDELQQEQAKTVQAAKLAALGTIASGIAHELNQPLTGILGYVQLMQLQMRNGAFTHESASEYLDFIERQVRRMTSIIGHVRTFALPSPADGQVEVNQVVQDAAMLMREQLVAHGIDLELRLAGGLPEVRGDAVRLEEVIINLLANAHHAIEERPGARKGTPPAAAGAIVIRTVHQDSRVVIEVSDNGRGIPANILPRVFEPFFTTRANAKGTGLGLSISHGVVRDHGGTIEVESQVGKGTAFYVYLPVPHEGSDASDGSGTQKFADRSSKGAASKRRHG